MNETQFAEFIESIKEMDKILHDEMEPGRVTSITELQEKQRTFRLVAEL